MDPNDLADGEFALPEFNGVCARLLFIRWRLLAFEYAWAVIAKDFRARNCVGSFRDLMKFEFYTIVWIV